MSQRWIPPTCIKSWNDKLHLDYNIEQWEKIFTLPFRCTNDINIKNFQLKILHRFYACQSLVSKWDKDTDQICILCKKEIANILHTFWGCENIKIFWKLISDWLTPILLQYTANLNHEKIFFGIIPYTVGNHCLNHCLFYCKQFIHQERKKQKSLTVQHFCNFYKNVLEREKSLYVLQNQGNLFHKLFDKILTRIENKLQIE